MTASLSGCIFDSGTKNIAGRYIVLWIDEPQNQTLSLESATDAASSSQIIPPYIFAVGHNNRFIIAKQHPTNGFEGGFKIDTSITLYYILDMKAKSRYEDYTLYGPLTPAAFISLSARFKLQQVPFDVQYPDNIYPTIRLSDSVRKAQVLPLSPFPAARP